jgi:hypothetical protein
MPPLDKPTAIVVPSHRWGVARVLNSAALLLLSTLLLAACSSGPAKQPQPRDPKFWTPDGYLRASAKDENERWDRIQKQVQEAGQHGPLHPEELLNYLRYSPDGPHAEEVRGLLATRLRPPRRAAKLVSPDAACRAQIDARFRDLFRLKPAVSVPADAFSSSPTVTLESQTGEPAPVEKRVIADMSYNYVEQSCIVSDRYSGHGFQASACRCAPLDPTGANAPAGRHADVLQAIGSFKAMKDACARHGVDLNKPLSDYKELMLARAEGEAGLPGRRQTEGKPLLSSEAYDSKVYALLLADLKRDAHSTEAYRAQAEKLATMTKSDAPETCKGASNVILDASISEMYMLKLRELTVNEVWWRAKP